MAETTSSGCGCGDDGSAKTRILYACSGAANVGEMADHVARALWTAGVAKRSCLSAIGAGLSGYIESAKVAENLVIDGCPVACGKKAFESRGLPFRHVLITDLGVEKGKTPVDENVVAMLKDKVLQAFGS